MLTLIEEKDLHDYFISKLELQNNENREALKNRQLRNEAIQDITLELVISLGGGICKYCGEAKLNLINDICEDCIKEVCL